MSVVIARQAGPVHIGSRDLVSIVTGWSHDPHGQIWMEITCHIGANSMPVSTSLYGFSIECATSLS